MELRSKFRNSLASNQSVLINHQIVNEKLGFVWVDRDSIGHHHENDNQITIDVTFEMFDHFGLADCYGFDWEVRENYNTQVVFEQF